MIAGGVCRGIRARSNLHLPENHSLLRSLSRWRRLQFYSTKRFVETKREKQKVIVISGPIGVCKSRLALELAKRLNGQIISADPVQVYRGLDIGSAKPSCSERSEVPHHLIDILHPSEDYSVERFYEDARQATQSILDSGRVPIVTGGTGFYLRWYMYGKPDVLKSSAEIAEEGHSELEDLQRWQATGSPPSNFQVPYDSFKKQNTSTEDSHGSTSSAIMTESQPIDLEYDFTCYFLSSPRVDLYRLIDFRCEEMLTGHDGILSEAKGLLDAGLLPNSNSATRAIGYRQAMDYLLQCREHGGRSFAGEFFSFLSEFQRASRNFAQRQLTSSWFRNEQIYNWLDASKPTENLLNFIFDAYHNQSGTVTVPESLRIKKDSDRQETLDLKAYRTKHRNLFLRQDDCSEILDWIRRTQA